MLPGEKKNPKAQLKEHLSLERKLHLANTVFFCCLLIPPLLSGIYSMVCPSRQKTPSFYQLTDNIQIMCFQIFAPKAASFGKKKSVYLTNSSLISTGQIFSLPCRFSAYQKLLYDQVFCLCYIQY